MNLADVYRIALLGELVLFLAGYGWSTWLYFKQVRRLSDPELRSVRRGVLDRTFGIVLLLLLFVAAIARRFGDENAGSLVFNLWLQVILVFWGMAWIRVDRKRFLTIEHNIERSDAALSALERVEAAQRHQEHKARSRRKNLQARQGT